MKNLKFPKKTLKMTDHLSTAFYVFLTLLCKPLKVCGYHIEQN